VTTYRVGNHQPQNVYRDDQYIGVMFTAEDAALVVEALNEHRDNRGLGCSLHGGIALGMPDGQTGWINCSYAICGHAPGCDDSGRTCPRHGAVI
jgi:hypothetical protein